MKNVTITLPTDLREEFARKLRRLSRRKFFNQSFRAGLGALLAAADLPPVVQRAMAEGSIGLNGKKLLFIFLRGGNDGLNTLIPVQDSIYYTVRPSISIPKDPATDYTAVTGAMDFPQAGSVDGVYTHYPYAIRAGNGFAAIHPSLKWLAPLYNAGHLAFIHRVAYINQSRSVVDSQRYWETCVPNDNTVQDGVFYRTIMQSGLANTIPLAAASFQPALPQSLSGSGVILPNFSDITRFNLLGVPNTTAGNNKFDANLAAARQIPTPFKANRRLLEQNYNTLLTTLGVLEPLVSQYIDNPYRDDVVTDDDQDWATAWGPTTGNVDGLTHGPGYWLFPTANNTNGGWQRSPGGSFRLDKYVADPTIPFGDIFFTSMSELSQNLLAAALCLNHTDTFIAGTEYHEFHIDFNVITPGDSTSGPQPNLLRRLSWALYALWKYFSIYGKGGSNESPGAKTSWDDLVIVTMSEFGRTTAENGNFGYDHGEGSVMLVAGGGVKGYGKPANTNGSNGGIFACNTTGCDGPAYNNRNVNWVNGTFNQTTQTGTGTLFAAANRYLGRAVDFRSVLGRIIRNHLGATQNQLNTIIPGYASESTGHLLSGGVCTDGVPIAGEPDFI